LQGSVPSETEGNVASNVTAGESNITYLERRVAELVLPEKFCNFFGNWLVELIRGNTKATETRTMETDVSFAVILPYLPK
jgi:hypothetical protein